jgi:hypothetical protein
MFISATPKRATLFYASDEESLLVIESAARDNSGTLEIGKGYVFASRKNRSLISRRHALKLQLRVRRRSSAGEEVAARLGLSNDKIGELSFCPPMKKDDLTPAIPASLEALVFLDDQLLDGLMNALLPGKRPGWIQLDIEREGALRYGWEPDGSRMEWKIENPSDPAYVDITRIEIGIELFR